MKKIIYLIFLFFFFLSITYAQTYNLEDILEDIYNQLSEDGEAPEFIQEELIEIAQNPINLNQTTANELSRLHFLSDEQIDAILLYQYLHPFQEIYELQLIDCLKDYEIRNLLPFVYVGQIKEEKNMYFREVFHYAKHEITLRTDARNIEDFEGDPMYGKLRYRFNYKNRVQAGVSVLRRQGDKAIRQEGERWDYGGYIQLKDIGPMKTVVAGNYQANFGYGLVIGSPFKRGKNAYIQSTATTDEGLKKFGLVGDSYNYFHGVGATAKVSSWADVSAFYSLRKGKEEWNHVVGVNATGRWNRLKVGITAVENIEATLSQFKERSQASYSLEVKGDEAKRRVASGVMGVNARWNMGKVDIWGEVATSHGNKWGMGVITGVRYRPISDVNLLAIYRYYSPEFDNVYANSLCSWSRMKDEHGGYLGVEYNRLKNWQLLAFGDVWKSGFETMAQADFIPQKDYRMHTRFRVKRKDEKDTYSLRWNMVYKFGQWKMKTQADGNLVQTNNALTYGWSLLQDVEYRFSEVPIVLQFRSQAFDAQEWNNRVYIYENDVLYAYAIPFVYGLGGRFWLNARYKINDIFSLYLRVSETIYQNAWAIEHNKKSTRTDVHALLRIKL